MYHHKDEGEKTEYTNVTAPKMQIFRTLELPEDNSWMI